MKNYNVFIVCFYMFSSAFAMAQWDNSKDVSNDSTIIKNVKIEKVDNIVYQLFPTDNIWTFIKLNTRNGQMWQVQYSLEAGDRFETLLNAYPQIEEDYEENGRFTLQPTTNTYNFILLDQIDGRVWQVQWSQKPEERFLLRIY